MLMVSAEIRLAIWAGFFIAAFFGSLSLKQASPDIEHIIIAFWIGIMMRWVQFILTESHIFSEVIGFVITFFAILPMLVVPFLYNLAIGRERLREVIIPDRINK